MKKECIKKEIKRRLDGRYSHLHDSAYHDGFVDGADWRINSVWKDASIEPADKKMLVILDKIGDMWECDYLTDPMPNYPWKVFVKEAEVLRWAYKEDLLPDTED